MDSTLNLSVGFKGQLKLTAQAVPLQEGYLKLGGTVDNAGGLAFGVAASSDPDTLDLFEAGIASGNVLRGIVVFDDAIAQNSPAHAGKYLDKMPCAVINHGFVWIIPEATQTATGAAAPTVGSKVICKDADGTINFLPAATSVPSGWTQITNASVRHVDANHGALIFMD